MQIIGFVLVLLAAAAPSPSANGAYEVILDNSEIAVLVSGEWCDGIRVQLRVVHKVPWSQDVRDTTAYRQRFERDILPAVRARCEVTPFMAFFLYNYVHGARITSKGVEKVDGYAQVIDLSLSKTRVTRTRDGWRFRYAYWQSSPSEWKEGDSTVASIASVQKRLAQDVATQVASRPRHTPLSERLRLDCGTLAAVAPTRGEPSTRDVCRAMEAHWARMSDTADVVDKLTSEFLGKRTGPPLTIQIVAFELIGCVRNSDGASYECDYFIGTKADGGGEGSSTALSRRLLTALGRARSDFVYEGGTWSYRPPPPTPYQDLPCCWSGDVRVRWSDCRENC